MTDDAAKQALLALHAHLFTMLPDIIKLEELLRASLAAISQGADVAAVLHQRQHQCVAAVALLRGLPDGANGRWGEGLQALLAARPFIESSAAMIRDVQNLLHVLTGPNHELPQQPSLGTTERTWRQHGIQLVRTAPCGQAAPASTAAPGQAQPPLQQAPQAGPQQPPQGQQQPEQQPPQPPLQQPAPLGLALLMQPPQAQQVAAQQQQQQHAMMPPQPPAAWAARAAQGAGQAPQAGQAPGPGPAMPAAMDSSMLPSAGPSLAAELLFCPSVEMLPVLPSVGVLPSLSQLLEEPMMTLSLKDDDWTGAAVSAAVAAVGAPAGSRLEAPAAQQQGPGAAAAAGAVPAMGVSGAAASPQQQQQQALPGLPDREESLLLLQQLLSPLLPTPRLAPVEQGANGGAVVAAAAEAPAAPGTVPAAPADATQLPVQLQPYRAAATVTTGPSAVGGGVQQPPAAATWFQQAPSRFQPSAAVGGNGGHSSLFNVPHQAAPQPSAAAPQATAAAQLAAADPAAAQHASTPALAGAPPAPLSPVSSGDQPQTSGGSGSLSYRRVSFKPLHSAPRASMDEVATPSSRVPSTASLPFPARPPPVSAATSLPFPARPPSVLPTPADLAAPPTATAAAAAAPAAEQPAAAGGAGGAAGGAVPQARVAVVQAGTAVRISQSAAAPVAPVDAQPVNLHSTTATAEGPVSYVSVHEAPAHEFSQGETSLTRLFHVVKATGVLPLPERVEESEEARSGGSVTFHSGRSQVSSDGTADGSGTQAGSCADSEAPQPRAAEGGRQTRQQSRRAQQAESSRGGTPVEGSQETIGGTKRRKAKQ